MLRWKMKILNNVWYFLCRVRLYRVAEATRGKVVEVVAANPVRVVEETQGGAAVAVVASPVRMAGENSLVRVARRIPAGFAQEIFWKN